MALTLTLLEVTPNSLKYRYLYDGSGSLTASRTRAQLSADCATFAALGAAGVGGASALKAAIDGAADAAAFAALADGPNVTLMITPEIQSVAASTVAVRLESATPGLAVVGVALANLDRGIIELRSNVSPGR